MAALFLGWAGSLNISWASFWFLCYSMQVPPEITPFALQYFRLGQERIPILFASCFPIVSMLLTSPGFYVGLFIAFFSWRCPVGYRHHPSTPPRTLSACTFLEKQEGFSQFDVGQGQRWIFDVLFNMDRGVWYVYCSSGTTLHSKPRLGIHFVPGPDGRAAPLCRVPYKRAAKRIPVGICLLVVALFLSFSRASMIASIGWGFSLWFWWMRRGAVWQPPFS